MRHHTHRDDDPAFLIGSRRDDALASELAAEAIEKMTSGEDGGVELRDEFVEEEIGGPFVESTADEEFADDIVRRTRSTHVANRSRAPERSRRVTWPSVCKSATPRHPRMINHSRLKLDVALIRTLLDEVERDLKGGEGVSAQLVEELGRLTASLSREAGPTSGTRLRDLG